MIDNSESWLFLGSDSPEWSELDCALVKAADELFADQMIGDSVWKTLTSYFSQEQSMDVIFTVGNYMMLAMALNTFGVQIDSVVSSISVRVYSH
jgi:alkylhydroperoxidase family enzyme